jgi:hypothetical protein
MIILFLMVNLNPFIDQMVVCLGKSQRLAGNCSTCTIHFPTQFKKNYDIKDADPRGIV